MMQMVQLWVNLPAKHKMDPPKYQPIRREEFGQVVLPDNKGLIEVIAGKFNGVQGPASSFTPIEMYNARLHYGADVQFSFPQNYNTAFLVVEGYVTVNGKMAATNHLVLLANDGTDVRLQSQENAVVLILSGEPINEPIVPYGPFVMNTKQEILDAYHDLNKGKFGFLED
jgi:redox-sensitive bicupin YhaK (pirin superfamily)